MANGYLGKISAIVTANTSELSRNLNAGAKDVRAFAQTVSRDISRVSSDAQRQFSQIFTPLQKFERALQAAASQKLSFKGFDGAIRTVEQLRSRLASLKDQNIINLAVKASGLASIDELRERIKDVGNREIRILAEVGGRDKVRALLEELKEAGRSSVRIKVGTVGVEQLESALTLVKGFTQRQVNILTNVGGLDKIRELRNTLSDTDGKTVVVNVGEVNAEELDKIAARLSSLDNKTIKAVIDVVGQASLDAALRKQRDLASAAQDIFRPLAIATSQFSALSVVIQNEFAGSLGRAQNASERLKNSIDDSTEISASRFGRVRRAVESVADAINRTSQLQQRASSIIGAGRSVELRAPGAVGAVDRASAVVQEIRQSPEAVRANPQVQQTVAEIETAIERLIKLQARFDSRAARGESVARVTREIERQIGAVDRLAERYTAIRIGLFAPFDDVLAQAQGVTSAFNALSAASRAGLAELQRAAQASVNAFQRTGQGIDEARDAVARFSSGVNAAANVDGIRNLIGGIGGGQQSQAAQAASQAFDRVAQAAASAFREFDALPTALRSRLLPALQDAANDAIELGSSIASGAVTGDRQIQTLIGRLGTLSATFRELSSFSADGLFRTPRDTRNVSQLNQAVIQLDAQFASLGSSSRSFLEPFTQQVQRASLAIRDAEIARAPRREINALVTDYRQAVRSLEAVIAQIQRTEQAFARATPQQGLAARLDGLIERYNRLGESGQRATRAAGDAARDAVAAAQDPNASATARVRAREALDVADREITSQERRQRVGDIFADSRNSIDAYIDRVDELEQRYRRMSAAEQRALAAQRAELQRAARNAAATGQDTEAATLRRQANAFGASLDNADAQRARDTRLQDIRDTFQRSVTGLPVNADDLRQQFRSLGGQLQSLDLADRISIAPLVEQFVQLEAATNGAGQEADRFADKLQILLDIEERISEARNRTNPTGPQGPPLPPGFGGDSRSGLGLPIEDPGRQFERLRGSLVAAKGQVDALPASLRGQFIPAIQEAERQFMRLSLAGPAATAEQIEAAASEVDRLTQRLTRAGQASQLPTFAQLFDGLNASRAIGELQGFQQVLARIGTQAAGPVAGAFDRYTRAVQEAVSAGTTGFPAVRRELGNLQREAIDAAVATGRISRGTARRLVQRGGDVASGAAGNAGLAVQQAVFAFEDFFSVTGGLDQRIRAAGNNLSQLGFILGGTQGLIIGVATAITGQLIAALIKWYNAGVDVSDQTKALNDSLSRQKSLAEDLAQAFGAVADAIADTGFSKQNKELRERQRLVQDIATKQAEQERERVASLDPDVQRERAIQSARQRELEAAVDPGERVRLAREIRASRERERNATNRAVAAPSIGAQQAVDAVAASRLAVRQAEIDRQAAAAAARSGFNPAAGAAAGIERERALARARAEIEDFRQRQGARIAGIADPQEQVRAVSALINDEQLRIQRAIQNNSGFFGDGANNQRRARLAELEQIRTDAEKDIVRAATNQVTIEATKTAIEAARSIGAAQELLAKAIGDGASQTRRELDRLDQALVDAEKRLGKAQEAGGVAGAKAAQAQIDAINASRQAYVSAATSVATFAEALDRVSNSLANTVASEARGRADQARRDSNRTRGLADAGLSSLNSRSDVEFRQRQRRRAEEDARSAEDSRDRIAAQNDATRRRFELIAGAGAFGSDIQRLIRQRDEAQRVLDDPNATVLQQAEATVRRDRANRAIGRAFEDTPEGLAAAEAADRADRLEQARRETEASIERGRELRQTPAQRAANDVSRGVRDITNSLDEEIGAIFDAAGGVVRQQDVDRARQIQQQGADELSNFVNEQARAAAPAIFSLADSVANALLQGPSRAALQATDVSTVEGQRELNRLLRGDDSARDQNIVELEKQSQSLQKLVDLAQEEAKARGIVLDLR